MVSALTTRHGWSETWEWSISQRLLCTLLKSIFRGNWPNAVVGETPRRTAGVITFHRERPGIRRRQVSRAGLYKKMNRLGISSSNSVATDRERFLDPCLQIRLILRSPSWGTTTPGDRGLASGCPAGLALDVPD